MQRRLLVTALVVAVSLAAGLAGAGCGGEGTAQTDSEVDGVSVSAATTASASGPAGNSTEAFPGAGSGSSGAVLGTTRAQLRADALDNTPVPLRIDVKRLRASGELIELEMTLTNEGSTEGKKTPEFQAYTMFGEGQRYDLSAVGLVDPAKQKLYLPVYDSEDKCLCTGEMGATEFAAGGSYTLAATYGGVPRDVTTLDVRIPQFPAVVGVRVER